jgi:hypothetical protein
MNLIINLFGGGLCGQVIEKIISTSNYRKGEEKKYSNRTSDIT